MYWSVSKGAMGLDVHEDTPLNPPAFHEMSSQTERHCSASQPVFMRDTL